MVGSTSMKKSESEAEKAMKTILVVDDEPLIREILQRQLKKDNLAVITCEDGKKALESFKESKPDLVLSDIRMPNGDGIFLLEEIMKLDEGFPVLLMTGFTDVPNYEVYHMGAAALVKKPFDLDMIVKKVKDAMVPSKTRWAQEYSSSKKSINLEFDSINLALEDQSLCWGRGGFSFNEKIRVEEGEEIDFTLAFKNGELKELKGAGVVRWNIDSPSSSYQKVGIEISALDPASLEPAMKLVDELAKTTAFIPAKTKAEK